MLRRTFLAAVAVALMTAPLQAAPAVAAKPEKKIDITQVSVINGHVGKVKLADLDTDFKLVAKSLAHKNATYTVEGSKLIIGIKVAGIADGIELEKLQFRSDCPDNSQFRVESFLAKRGAVLKTTTVAWTRHRHQSPTAPVRTVNIRNMAGLSRNYDVQLDLRKIASLDQRLRR